MQPRAILIQSRSEPVIRAIPQNRLYLTAQGAGAENFAALETTVAYPIWVKPMVPPIVKKEVLPLLEGQITTATSLLQNSYAAKDPRFNDISTMLNQLAAPLADLKTAMDAAKTRNPGKFGKQFDDCTDDISVAAFDLSKLSDPQVATSMPAALADLRNACSVALNQQLNDPAIQKAGDEIDSIAKQIDEKKKVVLDAAESKAKNDTAFVRRIIKTLVTGMNIVSIAPVAVADWARIGPVRSGVGGSRFGPGGGVRLELASYVNFTLGYAFNIGHQPGEGTGALFFSIGVRDLLH